MSEILVSNVKIPKKGEKALRFMIDSEGVVNIMTYEDDRTQCKSFYEDVIALELQSHGDLKDYDELGHKMLDRYMENKDKWSSDFIDGFMYALKMVDKAPVVVSFSK